MIRAYVYGRLYGHFTQLIEPVKDVLFLLLKSSSQLTEVWA